MQCQEFSCLLSVKLVLQGVTTRLCGRCSVAHSAAAAGLLCLQVAVNNSDIDFKWSIAAQLPHNTASSAAGSADAAAGADAGRHYGILLGKMAGLPASITDAALQIARRLDAKQEARQQQQEGDGNMQRLRQVYSLVHKLGCVAREAAAQGLLPTDAAGQPLGGEDGGCGSGDGSSSKQAELSRCMQLVRVLKQDAERLLLAAAREPEAS